MDLDRLELEVEVDFEPLRKFDDHYEIIGVELGHRSSGSFHRAINKQTN